MPESYINCSICGKAVSLSSPLSPFCSERCRLLDLGNWASGRYAIPAPHDVPADEDISERANQDGGE
jgi:endogenous inhibitor of DNA gyrase (YacG/DUF329 family)